MNSPSAKRADQEVTGATGPDVLEGEGESPVHWLTPTDSLFVSMETPHGSAAIAIVVPIDVNAPGFGGFPMIRRMVGDRLTSIPRLRWKLKETPLGLERPVWVPDTAFHLDHHVHRLTVPTPGGREEVGDLVGELMSRPLDRRYPLWQVYYLDGTPNGTEVVVAKFHHSIADGHGLANVVSQLFDDASPSTGRIPYPTTSTDGYLAEPSSLQLLSQGAVSIATSGLRLIRYARQLAGRVPAVVTAMRDPDAAPMAVPRSAFNGAVGPRRTFAFASVARSDVLKTKEALEVTLNDVVLAIVSGAVREYLRVDGQLPDHPLVAAVPMSTVDPDAADDSLNDVVNMWVSLPTNERSALERVHRSHRAAAAAKRFTSTVRRSPIESVGTVLPPFLIHAAAQLIETTHAGALGPAFGGNLLISNIHGPDKPRFAGGARVLACYPASIVTVNMGLNITLMSYDDHVDFGITVDPDIVRDAWLLADQIPAALAELMNDAKLGQPSLSTDIFARTRSEPSPRAF